MDLFSGIETVHRDYQNSIVCIGNFDGIHLGHREIIKKCCEEAVSQQVKSLLITFDRHPRNVIADQNNAPKTSILNTVEEKNRLLTQTRIDGVLYLKTDTGFLAAEPEDFLKTIIADKISAQKVIIGYDFRFGRSRKGDVDMMKHCGKKHNFQVEQVAAVKQQAVIISSSKIRQLLQTGDLEAARKMLGYHYQFSGKIVHGSGRGRKLGFPTANVELNHTHKLIPATGVYLVAVSIADQAKYGLANIGVRPTFEETEVVIEIYIYDNNDDLYGQSITVTMLTKMRDEIKYNSVDKLIKQMKLDKEKGLELIKQYN